jgi:hypothetical protein
MLKAKIKGNLENIKRKMNPHIQKNSKKAIADFLEETLVVRIHSQSGKTLKSN